MKSLRASSSAHTTSPVQRIRTSAGKNARGLHSIGRARSLARFMILGIIALAGLAFYSGSSAAPFFHYSKNAASALVPNANSSSKSAAPDTALGKDSFNQQSLAGYFFPTATSSFLPHLVAESIATFAADCTTPKTEFTLGETVCVKTDGVTATDHFVNWVAPPASTVVFSSPTITQISEYFSYTPQVVGAWKATIATPLDSSILPTYFNVNAGPVTVATYAGDCLTPKTVFNLNIPADLTVCAKVTGADPSWRIIWSNANGVAVQDVAVGSGTSTFTLTASSSLGDWRVILYEPLGGSVQAVTSFTVVDTANPSADLTISKAAVSSTVAAGTQAVFTVQVSNLGPSDATVQVSDSIPGSTTFASFALVSGPGGTNCVLPVVGSSSGTTVCTIPNLARGETATFLAAYDVLSGVLSGTVISNTASVSSSITDPNEANDSSTADLSVFGATAETCTFDNGCPANIVVTADTISGGLSGAFVSFGAASASGNCGAITNSPQSGSFFTVGTHAIISTSEIGAASCTFTVTVLSTSPPTITCPANITVTAPEGFPEATLNPGPGTTPATTPTITASGSGTVTGVRSDSIPATYDENGTVITPAVVVPLTAPYPVGTTGIFWTVTDAGGRTASCSQSITVLANNRQPVTIACPANVVVNAPSGTCQATISSATIGTPTTNPSDSNVVVVAERSDGLELTDPFPAGTTHITWTATDNLNGNVASCVQTVTVTVPNSGDTTPPTLVVPPNVATTTSSCTATLDDELGVAEASDTGTCGGSVTITRTGIPANFVFPTGTTTITYTATDAAGNTATGIQLVTVTESPAVPPTVAAPLDVSVNTGPDATLGTATTSDNGCPGVTVTRSVLPAGNLFPVGVTLITYTATDRSGNTASDQQVVTVVDNTPPVITCPADITTNTDPGLCSALINPGTGTATATDNCDSSPTIKGTRSDNQPLDAPYPKGTTTITWTATDDANNSSSCTQTVTVNDTEAPVITTNGQTLVMWPPNHKYRTFPVTNFVTGVNDNCDTILVGSVVIAKVTSDETENGNGDGNTLNDIVIADDCKSVQLRSERQGGGDGRVYTIFFSVTDASGIVGTATVKVVVPHNTGQTPVDSGPHYEVFCGGL